MTARSVENQTKVTHAFVYWENEDAGTLVPLSAIEEKNPVVGMITKVKSGGGKHDGKIIALGMKKDMDKVDQLFVADKFNPHDEVIPSLDQLLAIPIDDLRKQKKTKRTKAGKETSVEKTSTKPKKPKTGSIITVSGHGGNVHPSAQSTSASPSSTPPSIATHPATSGDARATPLATSSSAVSTSATPLPPRTSLSSIPLTTSSTHITLSDTSVSSSAMDISFGEGSEFGVRLENAEVTLAFMERRVSLLETSVKYLQSQVGGAMQWPTNHYYNYYPTTPTTYHHFDMGMLPPPPVLPSSTTPVLPPSTLPPPVLPQNSFMLPQSISSTLLPSQTTRAGFSTTMTSPAPSTLPSELSEVYSSGALIPLPTVSLVPPPLTVSSILPLPQAVPSVSSPSTLYSAGPSTSKPLKTISEVIRKNDRMVKNKQWSTLCQAIAKEAVFGTDMMAIRTPTGGGKSEDKRPLPAEGMDLLKQTMFKFFPEHHECPHLFEPTWKSCYTAVEQACGRLRRLREKTRQL